MGIVQLDSKILCGANALSRIEMDSEKLKELRIMYMETRSSSQNQKKVFETPNQPIRTKVFPRKLCIVP
jgi:hypothetical protein